MNYLYPRSYIKSAQGVEGRLDVPTRGGGLIGLLFVCEHDFFVRGGGIIFLEGPKRVEELKVVEGPGAGVGEAECPPLGFPVFALLSEEVVGL